MSVSFKLVNLGNILKNKKISNKNFAELVNMPLNVANRYINCSKCSEKIARKIAESLEVDLKSLVDENDLIEEIIYKTPCYNQMCPLCKDCICINDVVLTGRADCASKNKISSKNIFK